MALAGYWALLTTCTPTWHRNAVKVAEGLVADFIPLVARHLANEKPEYRDFVEKAPAKNWIKPNPDKQHIKAILTQQLTRTTLLLYQLDWTFLQNRTEAAFITSDNPSSVLPRRPFSNNLVRFLSLAPDFALVTVVDSTMARLAIPIRAEIENAFQSVRSVERGVGAIDHPISSRAGGRIACFG